MGARGLAFPAVKTLRLGCGMLGLALVLATACGDSPSDPGPQTDTLGNAGASSGSSAGTSGGASSGGASSGQAPGPEGPVSKAKALTRKLGGAHADHFLVGLGNDGTDSGNDPAYNLGVTLDLHYHYLSGLSTTGGWATWNKNPDYVVKRIRESKARGVVPMFTVYQIAAKGEANMSVLVDEAFMTAYFKDYAQALAGIAAEGGPVVLHIEPDFWGFAGQRSLNVGGLSKVPAKVSSKAPECASLPNDVTGFGKCLIAMARTRAPNAIVGHHASPFGTNMGALLNADPKFDVVADAKKLAAQARELGFTQGDLFVIDGLDRDAGCYEVGYSAAGETVCSKSPNAYWDETNVKLPNFKQFFTWAKTISTELDMPFLIWQIPFGEPSATPGTPGKWRDNRTKYFFEHTNEIVDAGGVGAVWGSGAPGQTPMSNGYKNGVKAYFAKPFALP